MPRTGASGLIASHVSLFSRFTASLSLLICLITGFSYLSFDIIGDLCFGEPFGMLEAGKDAAPVVEDTKSGLALYGEKQRAEVKYHIPAVRVLHKRGAHTASVGVLRPFWRMVINRALPWYSKGYQASQDLTRMAIAAVARRIAAPAPDRVDILSKLQEGVDDNGRPISSEELTAEAQTLMVSFSFLSFDCTGSERLVAGR